MANVNLTNITPPRVPLLDPKTNLISREWYRFFLNLFVLTGSGQNTASLTDLQLGPPMPTQEDFGEVVIDIESAQKQPTQESALDQIAELQKQIDGLKKQIECPCTELTAELQKQVDSLQMQPPVPEMVASGMVAPEPLWIDLVSRPSTLVGTSTVSGVSGDVRLHTKTSMADVYRFIPSTSDPLLDAFYSTFAASVLSGLIVSRG